MSERHDILVIGGSGQIGHQLLRSLRARGRSAVGTYARNEAPGLIHLDTSDSDEVLRVVRTLAPELIVNAVNSSGGADACEIDHALARRAHFDGARCLADAARAHGARLVQISTDYVFDGAAGPYRESDPPNPLSQLGRARLDAERYILDRASDALIVRTSFVFSWTPESKTRNFVMQIFDHAARPALQSPMKVPIDQVGNVTYAANFSEALAELIDQRQSGVFHLAGLTRCSKHAWALAVADAFGLSRSLFDGVTTQKLGQAAPRPLESGFVLDKVRGVLKDTRLMTLDEGLASMRTLTPAQLAG